MKKRVERSPLREFFTQPLNVLLALLLFFCALALLFFSVSFGKGTLAILAASAVAFLALEAWANRSSRLELKKAFLVGLFLFVLDFAFENAGMLLGY